MADKLIFHYLTFRHEIMNTLFFNVNIDDAKGHSLFSLSKSYVCMGGSANVDLEDGIKSPDFSMYDRHPTKKPITQAFPTVIWEVAYHQNKKDLACTLGRFVACSLGRVWLAISLKIEHDHAVTGQP